MKWTADAPSNIALIKYMGKVDHTSNVPSNPSFSYTLNHLKTFVEVEANNVQEDDWQPLSLPNIKPIELSVQGQMRYLNHVKRLKAAFDYDGYFTIRSVNNFPADCGLASSASSYAALTKAMVNALCELTGQHQPTTEGLADLSRQASGSSCRSFYSPWCLWDADNSVKTVSLPYQDLLHQVVVVDNHKKSISSSEAHHRVAQSHLNDNRAQRTKERLDKLLSALSEEDWRQAYVICWQEFWDMHALFETSDPPFGYMTPDSFSVLNMVRKLWQENGDGPLVTMDAGPNIHLLYRPDQQKMAEDIHKVLATKYQSLFSNQL